MAIAGTTLAGRGAAYVDTDCSAPLEDNTHDYSADGDVNVWLKLQGVSVGDLHWHGYNNGQQVAGGVDFLGLECTLGEYSQYHTGWFPTATDSYTLKVHFDSGDANFSGDSFRVVP